MGQLAPNYGEGCPIVLHIDINIPRQVGDIEERLQIIGASIALFL